VTELGHAAAAVVTDVAACRAPQQRWATRSCSPWSPERSGLWLRPENYVEAAIDQRESHRWRKTPTYTASTLRLFASSCHPRGQAAARRAVDTGRNACPRGSERLTFFVICKGKVAVTTTDDARGQSARHRVHGPGRFLGAAGRLEGQAPGGPVLHRRSGGPGEVLVVNRTERVAGPGAHDPVTRDLILARIRYAR